MIGVGASTYQGLTGYINIYEKNFDIFNIPRSLSDITNGQAFRGGGQSLQLNLMAGNLINSLSISLREPYLFDLPIGANASGYLFQRIYPNWDERRGGGSFSLGRQLGTSIYADFALRAEEVDFFGYRSPAPADYLAANGFTSLVSLKPSIRWDNRNNPFMPTKGSTSNFPLNKASAASPGASSMPRGECTFRPSAARMAPVSSSSPSAAISESRLIPHPSTSDSSPATLRVCVDSIIARSVHTLSAFRLAAS